VGAPDLYLYFLHVCMGWLRNGDSLAFVLPNKLLVNANGQRMHEWLLEEERLRNLLFATQAQVFPDAAVYPIVLFASGPGTDSGAQQTNVEAARIVRTAAQELAQGEWIAVSPDWYRRTRARAFFPPPESTILQSALERLLCQLDAGR